MQSCKTKPNRLEYFGKKINLTFIPFSNYTLQVIQTSQPYYKVFLAIHLKAFGLLFLPGLLSCPLQSFFIGWCPHQPIEYSIYYFRLVRTPNGKGTREKPFILCASVSLWQGLLTVNRQPSTSAISDNTQI